MRRLNHTHPQLTLWLLFMLARLPYLLLEYPGCIYPDTCGSIEQFFGYPDFSATLCSTDPSVIQTNHHPILYTGLFGGTIWLGNLIGSQAVAVCTFLLLQTVLHAWVLAQLFTLLRPKTGKWKVALWWGCVSFTALFPIYGFWSSTLLKDTFFATCMLWLMLLLVKVVQSEGKILHRHSFMLYMTAVALLFMLSKNQCVYIIILLTLIVVAAYKPYRWRLGGGLLVAITIYEVFLHVLLPACHVALSGRQELHGFMFQQTALYLKEHPDDVKPAERQAIAALLPYDSIAQLYNPDLQDPVKFRYNVGASNQAFATYRSVHLHMMLRHPDVAFRSLWRGCNAYFYPTGRFPLFYPSCAVNDPPTPDFYQLQPFFQPQPSGMKAVLALPVVGWFFDMGLYIPLVLLGCLVALCQRQWNVVLVLFPIIVSIGILIVSPENGCFRYAMPIVWVAPLLPLLLQTKKRPSCHTCP